MTSATLRIFFVFIGSCVCAASSASTKNVEYRNFRKDWRIAGANVTVKYGSKIIADDNSFMYAVCGNDKLPSEIHCNVTIDQPLEKWNSSSKSTIQSCSLKLNGSVDGDAIRHDVTAVSSVERFGQDRVLLTWWERRKDSQYEIENIRVTLLHMASCDTHHLTFPIDVDGHIVLSNLVIYPSGFDVVVSSRALCGYNTCRLSHDSTGKRVKIVPFLANFVDARVEPVAASSPDRGFYVSGSDIDSWKFRAVHLARDGQARNLMTATVQDPRQLYRVTSTSHELFAVCLFGDRRIHCAQFDARANPRMNASVPNSGNVDWMAVHNLRDDAGILLLTGRCNNQKCRTFKVMRVRQTGRRVKIMDVPELGLKCSNVPRDLVVNVGETDDEFCVYFACANVQSQANADAKRHKPAVLQFGSKCISKLVLKI
ncbi:uncharacterized protein LOC106651982 [Trichogramma pretiosum]|uniref:uncharacterized protein LOC106651982 n=1 Tax=Trichogramma pretiosum TaxID=7493 RepID=UPI000C71ACBB|nr:uncharacterized protein LOC106651982 [Trichogramma pretiosum]